MTWNHHHSRRVEFGIAASLTVVLVGLHLTVLTHAGALWRDEISSLRLATMPTLSGFWSSLALDPFPALYFLLLRLWNAIGLARIDFDLRLLGCLIGLLLIATLWWCCWRINRRAPIWPLVLFALNPVVIQFGDSLRAYGVGVIFIAVAFASIWKLTFRKNGIGSFAVAIAAALLSVQTLFTNALLLFAISFGALIVCIRRRLWWRAAAIFSVGLIAATSLLVYLPIFRRTREWSSLLVMPTRFSYVFAKYWQALAEGSSVVPYLWLCSMLVAAIVAILSQFGSRLKGFPDTDRDKILFSGVTLGTATFGTIIFFKVVSWPTSLWYFLPLMALSALCLHVIYSTLFENVRVRFVGWVAVLGVAGISILPAQRHSLIHLTNADLMAQAVASQAGKED